MQQKCWKNSRGFEAAPQSERPFRPVKRDDYVAKAHRRLFCRRIFGYFVCDFFPFEMSLIRFYLFDGSLLQYVYLLADGQRYCLYHGHEYFGVLMYGSQGTSDRHGPIYQGLSYGHDPMYVPWPMVIYGPKQCRSHGTDHGTGHWSWPNVP